MPAPAVPFSLFQWLKGQLPQVKLSIHLYKTPVADGATPTLADMDESTFPGYEPRLFVPRDRGQEVPNRFIAVTGLGVLFMRIGDDPGEETVEGHYEVAEYPDGYKELAVYSPLSPSRVIGLNEPSFRLVVSLTATRLVVGVSP